MLAKEKWDREQEALGRAPGHDASLTSMKRENGKGEELDRYSSRLQGSSEQVLARQIGSPKIAIPTEEILPLGGNAWLQSAQHLCPHPTLSHWLGAFLEKHSLVLV